MGAEVSCESAVNWLELVDLAQFQMLSYSETQDKGSATVWACFCCGGGLKRVGGGPRVTRAKHAHAFKLLLGHVLWHGMPKSPGFLEW